MDENYHPIFCPMHLRIYIETGIGTLGVFFTN